MIGESTRLCSPLRRVFSAVACRSRFLLILLAFPLVSCRTVLDPPGSCPDSSIVIIRGATVFAGNDLEPLVGGTVVIEDGRIAGVYARDDSPAIEECSVEVKASGSFILPGLWDSHVHISKIGSEVLSTLPSLGITGVRDMGSSMEEIEELRRRSREGLTLLPHISSSGPMYENAETFEKHSSQRSLEPWPETRRPIPDDDQKLVEELVALRKAGANFTKLRAAADSEQVLRFARLASDAGLGVATHPPPGLAPSGLERAGVLSIEHASYPYPIVGGEAPVAEVIEGLRKSQASIVPTIVAWQTQVSPRSELVLRADRSLSDPQRIRFIPPRLAVEWRFDLERRKPRSPESSKGWQSFYEQLILDLRALHAGGIPLVPGSDSGVEGVIPGISFLEELCAFEREVGMAPIDVLRASTVGAARLAGMEQHTGSLTPGKSADLIILRRDPRDGIAALDSLEVTYLRGEEIARSAVTVCR